jgi:hypothetical protein
VCATLHTLITQINRNRPPHYGADDKGSVEWAVRELKAEERRCWPRRRNSDPIKAELIETIRTAILRQLHPDGNRREMDHGVAAKANRLTVGFARFRYPTILANITEKQLRNRPRLMRKTGRRKEIVVKR